MMNKYKKVTKFEFRALQGNKDFVADFYCKNKIVYKYGRISFLKYLLDGKPFLNYEKSFLDKWTWEEKTLFEDKKWIFKC